MKPSLTISGIVTMVALPLIVKTGFSEQCANEIWTIGPMIPGLIMAWIGRVRAGGVNAFGIKTPGSY